MLSLSAIPPERSIATLLGVDVKLGERVYVGEYDDAARKQNTSCFFNIGPSQLLGPFIGAYSLPPGTYLFQRIKAAYVDRASYVIHLKRGDRVFIGETGQESRPDKRELEMRAALRDKGFTQAMGVSSSNQDVTSLPCSF